MKLVQLNIWQGRLLKQVVEFLEREQPDILCLQEVYSSRIASPLFDFLSSLEIIQQRFASYHTFFSPSYDMTLLDKQFSFGNAILSRFPLDDAQTTFVSGAFHSYKRMEDYVPNTRNFQRAIVRPKNGKPFCLFNHHAYWEITPQGSPTSVEKMQLVANAIAQAPHPTIFSGDLNVVASSPAMQPIHKIMRDLTGEHQVPDTLSSLGKAHNVACDHICVTQDVTVQQFTVSDELVSDHRALILQFTV